MSEKATETKMRDMAGTTTMRSERTEGGWTFTFTHRPMPGFTEAMFERPRVSAAEKLSAAAIKEWWRFHA